MTRMELKRTKIMGLVNCGKIGCERIADVRVNDPRYRWPTSLHLCKEHADELEQLMSKSPKPQAASSQA